MSSMKIMFKLLHFITHHFASSVFSHLRVKCNSERILILFKCRISIFIYIYILMNKVYTHTVAHVAWCVPARIVPMNLVL